MSTSTVSTGWAPVRGDRLMNGAIVIDISYDESQVKFGDSRPQGVVLALIPGNGASREGEYVTWTWVVDKDYYNGPNPVAHTFNGHYYESLANAVQDFEKRSK